jgi:hypothetical protein
MDDTKTALMNRFVHDVDDTYFKWLENKGLDDKPWVRAGFYSAIQQVVAIDPIPDQEMQKAIEKYVDVQRSLNAEEFTEEVEFLFMDVQRLRKLAIRLL